MKGFLSRRVSLSDESGFGLVEVMVTAVVIVLVATATVSSIGTAQKVSAKTQARGIAASLLEQDQERMRSFRASDLPGYVASRTVVQENVTYTINSDARFVLDEGGSEVNCTSTGSASRYLKLTSTVVPQASLDAPQQSVSSIYALPVAQFSPTAGTLIVNVYAADGGPQEGIPVSIAGPETTTATTNELGCAIFEYITPGSYTVRLDKAGYVNPAGDQVVNFNGTVTAGNINQATPQLYDRAGSITVQTVTQRRDGNPEPSRAAGPVTVSNSGIPSGTITSANPTLTNLFPFTGPYTAYAGACATNDPSTPANQRDYFTRPGSPGLQARTVLTAGTTASLTVREPAIYTKIDARGINGTNEMQPMTVRLRDPACPGQVYETGVRSDGTLERAGHPFGTYDICVRARLRYGTFWGYNLERDYYDVTTGVSNFDPNGMAPPGRSITVDTNDRTNGCGF